MENCWSNDGCGAYICENANRKMGECCEKRCNGLYYNDGCGPMLSIAMKKNPCNEAVW